MFFLTLAVILFTIMSAVSALPTPCSSSTTPTPTDVVSGDSVQIHWNFDVDTCLTVDGPAANGTPVVLRACDVDPIPAQHWKINFGDTKVQLADSNFCLDAGLTPANGVQLKIWECYDGLAAQAWHYTDDFRISLKDQGYCVDLQGGIAVDNHKVQSWQCRDENPNQVWTHI
ncbi:hypothetical protein HGRIS_010045 [Hohenbuehelia grisea]|uniref:Ricin B lectin domain-containing protein n=1 Tax=Hohenbuehelia grisea TaxID=104357 RepID=A0ABR3J397_9AGAR